MSEIEIKDLKDMEDAVEGTAAFDEEPEVPEQPVFTEEPETPEASEMPAFDGEPEFPETPEEPVKPAFVEKSEPAEPFQPAAPSEPVAAEPAAEPAPPEAPARTEAPTPRRKSPAIPVLAVCLALAVAAAAFLGTKCSSLNSKVAELETANAQLTEEKEDLAKDNEKLTAEVKSSAEKYQEKIKENAALGGYKSAVTGFYLDNAVIVLESDQDHYHRFGCPDIPASGSFWIFNSEAAIGYGCTECPTCHALSADEFCKKYIEN